MDGIKIKVHLFCMRLCHSIAPFIIAFPTEREESFFEAHQKGFEFFGGVSRQLIYDNLRTAVKEGWGKNAREQDKFAAFRAHHVYEALFCNPAEGHEKGLVENLVGYARRNFLVPVPRVSSFEELNEMLQQRCLTYIEHHQVRSRDMKVKEAYALEQRALMPLPVKWAGKRITVKASDLEVRIFFRGEELAVHSWCHQKNKTHYKLEHYLPLIEQRPRSVFHARPSIRSTSAFMINF